MFSHTPLVDKRFLLTLKVLQTLDLLLNYAEGVADCDVLLISAEGVADCDVLLNYAEGVADCEVLLSFAEVLQTVTYC